MVKFTSDFLDSLKQWHIMTAKIKMRQYVIFVELQ